MMSWDLQEAGHESNRETAMFQANANRKIAPCVAKLRPFVSTYDINLYLGIVQAPAFYMIYFVCCRLDNAVQNTSVGWGKMHVFLKRRQSESVRSIVDPTRHVSNGCKEPNETYGFKTHLPRQPRFFSVKKAKTPQIMRFGAYDMSSCFKSGLKSLVQ
jgi:hypothetical protein